MSRLLRWLVVLFCLAAGAYFALFVPVGGRTLWERIQGPPLAPGPAPAAAAAPGRPGAGPAGAPGVVKLTPGEAPAPATDMHTEADRAALDRLIEDRLKAGANTGAAAER